MNVAGPGSPAVGAGVTFDSVVILRSDGTGAFNDLISGTSTPLSASISGNTITGVFAASLVASLGLAPSDYLWNLWPRSPVSATGAPIAGNTQISDFAPDASDRRVSPVPEPSSYPLLGVGIGLLGLLLRRRIDNAR